MSSSPPKKKTGGDNMGIGGLLPRSMIFLNGGESINRDSEVRMGDNGGPAPKEMEDIPDDISDVGPEDVKLEEKKSSGKKTTPPGITPSSPPVPQRVEKAKPQKMCGCIPKKSGNKKPKKPKKPKKSKADKKGKKK